MTASAKNQLPMYRNIFNNARYYSAGAALLYENVFSGKKSADYVAPGVLCSTFCIELLLKCLILIRHDDVFTRLDVLTKGIRIDDHLYSRLFGQIEHSLQDRVVDTYNNLFGTTLTKQDYIALLGQLGEKGFVEWRYVYESAQSKKLDVQLQNRITDSLGNAIEITFKEKGL